MSNANLELAASSLLLADSGLLSLISWLKLVLAKCSLQTELCVLGRDDETDSFEQRHSLLSAHCYFGLFGARAEMNSLLQSRTHFEWDSHRRSLVADYKGNL